MVMIGLRNISNLLAKVPSLGYALMYLGLIPLFAFAYWFIPHSFYHSTVKYEDVLNEDADDILRDIREAIIDGFKRAHGGVYAEDGNWKLDITGISLHSLKSKAEETCFKIRMELWGINELDGIQSITNINVCFENKLTIAILKSGGRWIVFKKPDIKDEKILEINPSVIFPCWLDEPLRPVAVKSGRLFFPISKTLHEKILGFSDTVKGFPSSASGSYGRMFYLSAVTITTLGYGDIVPITTLARLLVAFESIAGIVFVGLFLNSLAREQTRT